MEADVFGGVHVPPPLVEYPCIMREYRERMYEVDPMRLDDFMELIWSDIYPMFDFPAL